MFLYYGIHWKEAKMSVTCSANKQRPKQTAMNAKSKSKTNISVAKALQEAGIFLKLFQQHMPDFTDMDPGLDAAFANDWAAALAAGLAFGTDETWQDELRIRSRAVDDRLEEARSAVALVRYYAERAFKNKPRTMRSLGFPELSKYRKDPARVVLLLEVMHRRALALDAELVAQGLTPAQRDQLLVAAAAVKAAELNQEEYKLERLAQTDLRQAAMEHAWSFVQLVSAAAEVVYRTDAVKRALFVIGQAKKTPNP